MSHRRSAAASRWRRVGLTTAGILMGGAALILFSGVASAHANLNASSPANGADLSSAPRQLTLSFSESVVLGATSIELVDSAGRNYPVTHLRLQSTAAQGDTEVPVALVADLPNLPRSAYRLSWQTLSSDDLHRTHGLIVFGVAAEVDAADAVNAKEPLPSGAEAALRWLMFAAIAAGLGGLLGTRLLSETSEPATLCANSEAIRYARRITVVGAGAGAATAAALLEYQTLGAGTSFGQVLSGRYGLGWGARELGLLALALGYAQTGLNARSGRSRRVVRLVRGAVLTATVVMVLLGSALVGHSSAASWLGLGMDALHLGAVALWVGGLLTLVSAVALAGRSDDRTHGIRALQDALVRFGRPAGWSAAVAVATGIYLTGAQTVSVDAVLKTFYGRSLLVKVGLVATLLALGARHHRTVRRSGWRLRRGSLLVEVVAALLVLGVAAVLTSSQPAREPRYLAAPAATTAAVDDRTADLQQTVSVAPNRPGQNLVVIEVFDTRRPPPGPIVGVLASVRQSGGPPSVPRAAQALSENRWTIPVELAAGGPIRIEVTIRRAGNPDVTTGFNWVVGRSSAGAEKVLISDHATGPPLRSTGVTLISLLAGLALASQIAHRLRRRTRPRERDKHDEHDDLARSTELATAGAE